VTQASGFGRILRHASARHGAEDWWAQRVTALALVPLSVWFCVSMLLTPAMSYFGVRAWMTRPWNTVFLVAFILVAAYHSYLGLRVVVEDYVHEAGMRIALVLLIRFVYTLSAAGAVLAVCVVVFGGFA
jgi:succinate dehydrogenase / fumarate reductase membrane anchor subunit